MGNAIKLLHEAGITDYYGNFISLNDQMKMEHLVKILEKYSLSQLTEKLPE